MSFFDEKDLVKSQDSFFEEEDLYKELKKEDKPIIKPKSESQKPGILESIGHGISEAATFGADKPIGGISAVIGETIARKLEPESKRSAKRTFEQTKQNIVKLRKQQLDKAIAEGNDEKVSELTEKIAQTKKTKTSDIVNEYEPLKTYIEAKKTISERQKQAWEEHPLAYLGGSLVGGSAGFGAAGKVAKRLTKLGKVGKTAAKILPTTEGIEKAVRIGKRAKDIKHLENLTDTYNKLQKLKKIKMGSEAFKVGAKAGGITGIMTSEGELTKAEIGKIVQDTTASSLTGGITGYGLTKAGQVAGEVVKRIPILNEAAESFVLGLKGTNLDPIEAKNAASKAANKWLNTFGKKLNSLGSAKKRLYKLADKIGTNINVTDDLAQLREEIKDFNPTERKIYSDFINIIDSYYAGTSPELMAARKSLEKSIAKKAAQTPIEKAKLALQKRGLKKAIEQKRVPIDIMEGQIGAEDLGVPGIKPEIKSQVRAEMIEKKTPIGKRVQEQLTSKDITPFDPSEITRSIDPLTGREMLSYTDKATGSVVSKVGEKPAKINASKLSLDQAEKLIDQLNLYSGQTAEKQLPKGVKGIVRKTAQNIRNNVNKSINKALGEKINIKSYNKKLNTLLEGTDRYIGLPQKGEGSAQAWKDEARIVMSEFLAGTKDQRILTKKDQLVQRIHDDVSPQLAKEFSNDLNEIKKLYDLSKVAELTGTQSSALQSLLGKAVSRVNQVSNALGLATKSPLKNVSEIAQSSKKIIKMKSPQINNLVEQMMDLGKPKYNEMFYRPLQKAMNSSEKTKNAILFGLMQRPEFQEMVKEVQEKAGIKTKKEEKNVGD